MFVAVVVTAVPVTANAVFPMAATVSAPMFALEFVMLVMVGATRISTGNAAEAPNVFPLEADPYK